MESQGGEVCKAGEPGCGRLGLVRTKHPCLVCVLARMPWSSSMGTPPTLNLDSVKFSSPLPLHHAFPSLLSQLPRGDWARTITSP